jgi:mono/diheme cytochrome c family protein
MPPLAKAPFLLALALAGGGLCWLPPAARAHPLKAEPLDHAHVYAFDQFYLPEDDDAFLTQGGLVLLAELSCASCHSAPPAWQPLIGPKPGPDLSAVGSRLDMDSLWRFIRSPQHRKPGTQMPGLFAGNQETDADTIEALATYLSTLAPPLPPVPAGDPLRGQTLYHTIGCVACHEPATDYRPPQLPPEAELESPSLPSVPIALADDYSYPALTAFLLSPLTSRPASRMPDQHLSPTEAADLAAYLHTDRKPAQFRERQILNLAPQTAEHGQHLFHHHRCTACHTTAKEPSQGKAPPPLRPLAQIQPHHPTGCLTSQHRTGVPRYDLSPLQIRALKLALTHLQTHPKPVIDPPQHLDHQLARLNCYACHDQDGKGGPEYARSIYFATQTRLRPNDDIAQLPPSLDHLTTRFTPADLIQRLTQPAASQPDRSTRMPSFHPQAIRPLLHGF